jgi:hypothetical protein
MLATNEYQHFGKCIHIWLGGRSVPQVLHNKSNRQQIRRNYQAAMTNQMDQTPSNTSIDNGKIDTIQPISKEISSKEDAVEYPPPAQAALVMLALLLALFLTAIVRINQPTSHPHPHPQTSQI